MDTHPFNTSLWSNLLTPDTTKIDEEKLLGSEFFKSRQSLLALGLRHRCIGQSITPGIESDDHTTIVRQVFSKGKLRNTMTRHD